MKKTTCILVLFCLILTLLGCVHDEMDYKKKLNVKTGPDPQLSFVRYEDVLFRLDTARFQQELMAIQHDFQPFLNGDLTQPQAVQYLKDFATDTFSLGLYQKVKQVYPDLDKVEKMVKTVYRHFNYYFPDIRLPERVFTCVSGISPENPAVIVSDDAVVISLDWYLDHDEVYDQIGLPLYLSERTGLARLPRDLGEQLYTHFLPTSQKSSNLLEEMLETGRMDYFIEALYPDIADKDLWATLLNSSNGPRPTRATSGPTWWATSCSTAMALSCTALSSPTALSPTSTATMPPRVWVSSSGCTLSGPT